MGIAVFCCGSRHAWSRGLFVGPFESFYGAPRGATFLRGAHETTVLQLAYPPVVWAAYEGSLWHHLLRLSVPSCTVHVGQIALHGDFSEAILNEPSGTFVVNELRIYHLFSIVFDINLRPRHAAFCNTEPFVWIASYLTSTIYSVTHRNCRDCNPRVSAFIKWWMGR